MKTQERGRERQRQTQRHTERQKETDRQKETETEREKTRIHACISLVEGGSSGMTLETTYEIVTIEPR